jgi:hypothetical protein
MPKTIDKKTLEALLNISTKAQIAQRFGITTKSVTRLIRQYGLPNPQYVQSDETKRLRVESIQAARRRDPSLVESQIKGLRAHNRLIKGKQVEEVYPPDKAEEIKRKAREARMGKPSNRKPREGPKFCSICGAPVEPGGGKKVQAYCKSCMSTYFKGYYGQRKEHYKQITNKNRRRRQAIWREYLAQLKNRACKDCGKSYPSYCMDFDHLAPETKVADIPIMLSRNASEERILAEIEKTEIVCANCHRGREHKRYLQNNRNPAHLSPRQKRNKESIEQSKNRPCADCGGEFSSWQKDFDHVNGEKVERVNPARRDRQMRSGLRCMSSITHFLEKEIDLFTIWSKSRTLCVRSFA